MKLFKVISSTNASYFGIQVSPDTPEMYRIRQLPVRYWNKELKLWLIPYSVENWKLLKSSLDEFELSVSSETIHLEKKSKPIPSHTTIPTDKTKNSDCCTLNENQSNAVNRMTEQLIIQKYSQNTRKNYLTSFTEFLAHHKDQDPKNLTEDHFRQYTLFKIQKHHISESTQNNIINALKFYYEKVELRPRFTIYDIRPRSPKKLPGFLSKEDVERLLKACTNIKHQTILKIIYSAGLRLGELTRLKTRDILFDQGLIRVRCAKGKKDRYTILSPKVAKATQDYILLFKPNYWLFEGQDGGKYSDRSVQNILKAAVIKSGIDENTTVHTLRHSFATHLIMNGIDIRTIQKYLGHESIKTTEIYTHITDKMKAQVKSPIDDLDI